MKKYHDYLSEIRKIYGDSSATELSGRTPLQNLLTDIAKTTDKSLNVVHEATTENRSIPDFKIEHATAIIGYLEVKKPDTNLDQVLESEQIKKYKDLNNNIVITDYAQWIRIKGNTSPQRITLFYPSDLHNPRFRLNKKNIDDLDKLLLQFMASKPRQIANVKELAEALAMRSRHLKTYMEETLKLENGGRLHGLYEVFRQQLHPQLSLEEFADTYAQMLNYGLFMARLNASDDHKVTLKNAEDFIPRPFELMHELVGFLRQLATDRSNKYAEIKWVAEEILLIINYMDREAIAEQLSFKNRPPHSASKTRDDEESVLFQKDPFVYFYEDFLKAYDEELRQLRGVYYTPPPVVNFIIRCIGDILKNKFDISAGLANTEKVTVLDFACGTGTFILEIFQQILDSIDAKTADFGKAPSVIKEHLLKNIHGFEFLIAAYAIAHLKLWQYLNDRGYQFTNGDNSNDKEDKDRLQVFLTNTLSPATGAEPNLFLPALSEEAKASDKIKDKDILVITGNPPYSVNSQNPSKIDGKFTEIGELMEDYKEINGRRLGEKNPKSLQDDYVKFIRFAQHKMQCVDEGVVGIITNHGFIDNKTFSGMRYSLMQTFDQIYILDLHGAIGKPNDKNVFDIKTGVAISFFIKNKNTEKGIFHADLWGTRSEKYKWLANSKFTDTSWVKLNPSEPRYLFIPRDDTFESEYNEGWAVENIFRKNSVGITTARDSLAIQFSKKEIKDTVKKLASMEAEEARKKLRVGADTQEWKISSAQKDVREHGQGAKMFQPVLYRPFDRRFTYYSGQVNGIIGRPRKAIMGHMAKDNCALITVKQNSNGEFSKAFVANDLAEFHITGGDVGYVFPLYTYCPKNKKAETPKLTNGNFRLINDDRQENFKNDFRKFINKKYKHEFSPEEIMAYIYAILNSPTYRTRYGEFLQGEFPRIPFCKNKQDFINVAKIGQKLIDLHLINQNQGNLNLWRGKGNNFRVEKVNYNEDQKQLCINKEKYLEPVPKGVWEFKICGFQALREYLKSRKNRDLDLAEITHIENIVYAIQETIKAMQDLDSLTPKIFPHWHK